ncbi:hypothetical protein BJX61DRAFT_489792 [Aspergillus egyptiacus]|nr:hypothetical protein BJX61DRAFT_489792 [Aspergillus egyptiacus]
MTMSGYIHLDNSVSVPGAHSRAQNGPSRSNCRAGCCAQSPLGVSLCSAVSFPCTQQGH